MLSRVEQIVTVAHRDV